MNPEPFRVSVCAAEPAATEVGDSEVIEGTGLLELPPPPPQPGRVMKKATTTTASRLLRWRLDMGAPIRHIPTRSTPPVAAHQIERFAAYARDRTCPRGVVLTVSLVVLLPVT